MSPARKITRRYVTGRTPQCCVGASARAFNAEAGRSLERVHGLTATYRVAMCRIGAWIGRRAILTLGTEEVWGQTIG